MEIRRAADRASSQEPGILGRHSFSYGSYYDPTNVCFGPLIAANVFELEPGAGFGRHPHSGVSIVTWVAEGELTHTDSVGRTARLSAGSAAVLCAGDGVEHSERNEGPDPTRIVQLFLHPSPPGPPRYQLVELPWSERSAGLPEVTIRHLEQPPGSAADLPAAAGLWALVLTGAATVADQVLQTGDELRARPGPRRIRAGAAGARVLLVSLD